MQKMKQINFRNEIRKVFKREKNNKIIWQPRLEHWYETNKEAGTLPEKYRNRELLDICNELGVSVRPHHIFERAIKIVESKRVKLERKESEKYIFTTFQTPKGNLTQRERKVKIKMGSSSYNDRRIDDFLVKKIGDLKILAYILRARKIEFDREAWLKAENLFDQRTEPVLRLGPVSVQRLSINYMGFENTIYALHDYPREMEKIIRVIEETDEAIFQVAKTCPAKIINLSDNVHSDMTPPPTFKRYILPYYQRRTGELRKAGKFIYAHWDGHVKPLLRFAQETGLDGIEGLTPLPQGDVSLKQIKEGLGDMILIDGIPAIHFLLQVSLKELEEFTKRVLQIFSPYLILGISDMMPPPGDIERVRLVSQIVKEYNQRRGERDGD